MPTLYILFLNILLFFSPNNNKQTKQNKTGLNQKPGFLYQYIKALICMSNDSFPHSCFSFYCQCSAIFYLRGLRPTSHQIVTFNCQELLSSKCPGSLHKAEIERPRMPSLKLSKDSTNGQIIVLQEQEPKVSLHCACIIYWTDSCIKQLMELRKRVCENAYK